MQISSNISEVIRKLETYRNTLHDRMRIFMEKLAEIGAADARVRFETAKYEGDNDVTVSEPEWISENTLQITASGGAVLFIEFGAGYQLGFGHEKAAEMGYGPGTWSEGPEGKGHWLDQDGWYYRHGEKTIGNPPARAMMEAANMMRERITEIAREVFGND